MAALLLSLLVLFLGAMVQSQDLGFDDNLSDQFTKLETSMADRQREISELAHQLMLNRFYAADRIRSEGDSGLVAVRHATSGSFDYHTGTTREYEDFAAMHEHNTHRDLLGMGEVLLDMNGVQFATRHNDYRLVMPSSTSRDFHATEPIPPTAVPQTVLDKQTIAEQVDEMVEYFRAFKLQDESIRPYKDHFRPVMCYVEGKWLANTTQLVEIPDTGDYGEFQAETWDDLTAQAQMNAQTGTLYFFTENTPNMPRGIVGLNAGGMPIYAQWHYRVLCHPIREDIPTEYFRLADDLNYRIPFDIPIEDLYYSRGARFILDDLPEPGFYEETSLLDRCVGQIPGLDNVPTYIKETDYLRRDTRVSSTNQTVLNAGFYNRCYYDQWRDLSRRNEKFRGFSDANLFISLNEQPDVAPMNITFKVNSRDVREYSNLRFSWMLPLEMCYRTPLSGWNPHGIHVFEGDPNSQEAKDLVAHEGNSTDPYQGVHEKAFYLTPSDFYTTKYPVELQKSDDWYKYTYVTSTIGDNPALVTASGMQRLTSPIKGGVDTVRLCYPIMPLHHSGSPIMKEVSALKTLLTTEMKKLADAFNQLSEGKK